MTAPVVESRARRLLQPAVVLPFVAVVLVIVALLTPEVRANGREGDQRLTTYSHDPMGAALLHDVAQAFGWRTTQWSDAALPADSAPQRTVIAELAPPIPLSEADAHTVLERVRRGAGLLYVIGGAGPLYDSLRLRQTDGGTLQTPTLARGDRDRCADGLDGADPLWPGADHPTMNGLRFRQRRVEPTLADTFATIRRGDTTEAVAIGYSLGAGRVVAVADPDMFRNDYLRVCHWRGDVIAARELEFLAASDSASGRARTQIVFDEYHQGYGLHPGSFAAVVVFISRTEPGRVLAQILLGCIVLVFATGMRTLPPRDDVTPERRSPLEHVDALGRAYEAAGATQIASERLLHGVRRRAMRGLVPSRRARTDGEFLEGIALRYPSTRDDVRAVEQALRPSATRDDLVAAGEALHRIEATLSTPAR